jgi:uncharacterized protein YjaG (DUF416 family)
MDGRNTDRLREAGLIADSQIALPQGYYDFLEDLEERDVDLLIDLKQRLDARGIPTQILTAQALVPIL